MNKTKSKKQCHSEQTTVCVGIYNLYTVTMSAVDAVKIAGDMVYAGDYNQAQDILIKMPQTHNLLVEIERWYLLAQIEQKKGNVDEAIRIYRKILDEQPKKTHDVFALCCTTKQKMECMGFCADFHVKLYQT